MTTLPVPPSLPVHRMRARFAFTPGGSPSYQSSIFLTFWVTRMRAFSFYAGVSVVVPHLQPTVTYPGASAGATAQPFHRVPVFLSFPPARRAASQARQPGRAWWSDPDACIPQAQVNRITNQMLVLHEARIAVEG